MSTTHAVSIEQFWEEYADSDQGRWEYADGHLIELPMPDWFHGLIVQRICYLMASKYPAFAAAPEVDSRLGMSEVRRPDVAVQRVTEIREPYPKPDTPLYLAIEVLSPGSQVGERKSVAKTFAQTVAKYEKSYAPWGVLYCWILDPHSREAWHNKNDFRHPVAKLEAGEISFSSDEIFAVLNDLPTHRSS
jgi:Uma2 family endonuclease